jgi:hypothetical protein
MDPLEIDEIQIITSWIHKHASHATILYVEHRSVEALKNEFSKAIRNTHAEVIDMPNEYSQLSCSIDV